jgi:hypothetical protein
VAHSRFKISRQPSSEMEKKKKEKKKQPFSCILVRVFLTEIFIIAVFQLRQALNFGAKLLATCRRLSIISLINHLTYCSVL